ncbi:MAG: flagellar filament capping protein FliD [Thermomonas hydrothermalis]|uniref:flagellar filament capping protein FliD n=1 Tax=Thermomonas hydrothermalis TaxID=213588 RepID=UPI002356A138|nr:flagellar filament capping protein FliD [Thermomonas hydrothermalis]MCL6618474.1 flagellar filament capping protein FliD [Thermomonas hydrothermalis]
MGITASGIGSGLDVNSIVSQLMQAERAPAEKRLTAAETETKTQISAFGTLSSVLSSLQSALKKFDGNGALAGRTASTASDAGFSASASTSAAPGRYMISVEALAQAHRLQSAVVARNGDGSQPQLGYGTLAISVGGSSPINVTITQGSGTLNDIRNAINNQAGDQVSATVVRGDAGDVLFITSRTTGSNGAISIVASGGDGGLGVLDTSTGTIITKDAAQDAQVVIDGITRTSSSNTITDAISGVTLTLTKAVPGTPSALEVKEDPTPLKTTLNGFISAYNTALAQIRSLSASGGEGATPGPLSGDAATRSIQQSLRNAIGASYQALSALGLKTAVDGSLTLDTSKLDAALASDPNAIKKVFGENADFGHGMRSILQNMLGDQGLIPSRQQSLNDRTKAQAQQRTVFEDRMARLEATYRRQFSALDTLMAQLQGTSNYVSQQLAQLNKAP